ncbi:hypothetical protein PLESTB_000739300 [Pleodorina starrii]|uniref:Uncharacterized protein n=1 Tax=Pleodorina starrii TaxID=330485 RepID=A0A9W6BJY4_9CHLO|nr:hypothetical protein PLESTB_000739300 [Pleodorina starrii]
MHGFLQDPTAYALLLTQLAKEAGVLVIAPCPDASTDPETQQRNMVDAALFWHNLIVTDNLPGMQLGNVRKHVGLLGHSVGGGLAPYVVHCAAKGLLPYAAAGAAADDATAAAAAGAAADAATAAAGAAADAATATAAAAAAAQGTKAQPFFAAHVMAPQTDTVPRYDEAEGGQLLKDVGTEWGVQYGRIDLLSLAGSVEVLCGWLQGRTFRDPDTVPYLLGTHVGFEDQLVVNGKSFSHNILRPLLAALWAVLAFWVPGPTLRGLSSLSGGTNLRAAAPPAAQQKRLMASAGALPPGFGPDDYVELPHEAAMLAGYAALALAVTRFAILIPLLPWSWASVLKAALLALAAFAGYTLLTARPQTDAASPPPPQQQQPSAARPEAPPSGEGGGSPPPGYTRWLALAAVALALYTPTWSFASNWAALAPVLAFLCKALCCVLTPAAWPFVALYPYEAWVQRPGARKRVVQFFKRELERAGAEGEGEEPQGGGRGPAPGGRDAAGAGAGAAGTVTA